jgi:hypothetical protein
MFFSRNPGAYLPKKKHGVGSEKIFALFACLFLESSAVIPLTLYTVFLQ